MNPRIQISKRQKRLLAGYGVVMIAAAAGCYLFPDDETLSLPVASFFGPFLGLRLGWAGGLAVLLIVLELILPFVWKPNVLTSTLLLLGIAAWAFCGYITGLALHV